KELQLLDEAVEARDSALITQVAHSLKGAAANLSAESLSELARELENSSRHNEWQNHVDLVYRIREEFGRCVAALPALNHSLTLRTAIGSMLRHDPCNISIERTSFE